MHASGLHQDPMNGGDGDAGPRGRVADFLAGLWRNVGDAIGDGEGSNLDGIVTGLSGIGHRILEFPVLEDLVANAELHGASVEVRSTKFKFSNQRSEIRGDQRSEVRGPCLTKSSTSNRPEDYNSATDITVGLM